MAAVILHDHAGIINLRIKVAGIRPAIPRLPDAIANEGDASVIQACHAAAMGVGVVESPVLHRRLPCCPSF